MFLSDMLACSIHSLNCRHTEPGCIMLPCFWLTQAPVTRCAFSLWSPSFMNKVEYTLLHNFIPHLIICHFSITNNLSLILIITCIFLILLIALTFVCICISLNFSLTLFHYCPLLKTWLYNFTPNCSLSFTKF